MVVVGLGLVAACTVDTRSGAFECVANTDCSGTRTCQMGFCVLGDPGGIDGGDAEIDSGVGTPDAQTPDSAVPSNMCPSCGTGACTAECGSDCNNLGGDCPAGCTCNLDCAGAENCDVDCNGGSGDRLCNLDCSGANNCKTVTCRNGADCDIECGTANNCDDTQCLNGSECILRCDGTIDPGNCVFSSCTGGSGEASCPNNIRVCNRACP